MLGSVESGDRTVVADFEAGIGTLTRMGVGDVDAVVIVVEPTPKSMEVGTRAANLARERALGRIVVVGNRIRDDSDRQRLEDAFSGHELVVVPDDPQIRRADRDGVAPIDLDPDGPAVTALRQLADRLGGAVGAVT